MKEVKIQQDWKVLLEEEFGKEYFIKLTDFVRDEYKNQTIYPPAKEIFAAFNFVSPQDVKVVILGQDPYHGAGQAHGLCFSVPNGVAVPKSLQNIFKELASDVQKEIPHHGNLENWAQQGVFLLNAALTVRAGQAGSHQKSGWLSFTDRVIEIISEKCENVVFMLWGNFAKEKSNLIDSTKHLILTAPHPSPLAAHRGFFGCQHFSKANEYLIQHHKKPIDW